MDYVRLPLEGTKNTRDLGGYPTKDNKVTKFHTFIRSDRLTNITDKDNEFLKNYGITDIIDLRGNTTIQSTFVSDDNINREYFLTPEIILLEYCHYLATLSSCSSLHSVLQ